MKSAKPWNHQHINSFINEDDCQEKSRSYADDPWHLEWDFQDETRGNEASFSSQ